MVAVVWGLLMLPVTVTCGALVMPPEAGAVMVTSGGVESRVTTTVLVAEFPARSVATRVMLFAPGVSASVCSKPDSCGVTGRSFTVRRATASSRVPATETCGTLKKALSSGAVTVMTGGTVSRTTVTGAEAKLSLPALSMALAVKLLVPSTRVTLGRVKFPCASAVTVPRRVALAYSLTEAIASAVPASVRVATLVGDADAEMTGAAGAVESRVTPTEALPELPARSAALTFRTLFPSARV